MVWAGQSGCSRIRGSVKTSSVATGPCHCALTPSTRLSDSPHSCCDKEPQDQQVQSKGFGNQDRPNPWTASDRLLPPPSYEWWEEGRERGHSVTRSGKYVMKIQTCQSAGTISLLFLLKSSHCCVCVLRAADARMHLVHFTTRENHLPVLVLFFYRVGSWD